MRTPGRPTQGFTLIELLVALALLAVLAIMSWRGIDGMARTVAHTQQYSDSVQTLQTGLAQWTTDLDAATLPSDTVARSAVEWDGRVLRLMRRDVAGQGWLVVAWALRTTPEGAQWVRWQSEVVWRLSDLQTAWRQASLWSQGQATTATQRETPITLLSGWQLYYYRGNAWTNALSSAGQSSNDSTQAATPPDGIRLVLDVPEGQPLAGRITRDWVRPTLGGNKS